MDHIRTGKVTSVPAAGTWDRGRPAGIPEIAGGTPAVPGKSQRLRLLTVFALIVAFCSTVSGHTPDTSYCRVVIGREVVAFTFTFDVLTLGRMAAVDANRDGAISREELGAATPALESFIRRSVYLELNERDAVFGTLEPPPWPKDAGAAIAAADFGQRLITFVFRNPVLHAPDSVGITFDFFGTLGVRHTVLGNFVWSGMENAVNFTRFEPDYLFDTGYRVPAAEQFGQYLALGVTHILRGYDHLAFLVGLLFVRRFGELVKIITAFSVAHTVTLALSALNVVSLPSRFVESLIAASIVYVAVENLWRESPPAHRWRITFAFGLVHGFGFASILRELGLPADGLVRSLLAFNLGVELGQLAIAGTLWPLLVLISRKSWAPRVKSIASLVLLTFGSLWLIDRAFALGLMPL